MNDFSRLSDEILECLWKKKPVEATFLGIHEYDHTLGRQDISSHKEFLNTLKKYLERLSTFEQGKELLGPDERMDSQVARNFLEAEMVFEQETERITRDASIYPETVLHGLYILIMRNFSPLYERMAKLLKRLEEVPEVLIIGRENLLQGNNIPRVWTEIALEITVSGIEFLLKTLDPFIEEASLLKEDLIKARYAAVEAFSHYQQFLETELLPLSTGDFAVGKNLFEFLLKKEHCLSHTSEELVSIGENIICQTKEAMNELSKTIDSSLSTEALIAKLKEDHPQREELLLFYKKEMERAKEFIAENGLVSIPAEEEIHVLETPLFERSRIPYAAYIPPAPFEKNQKGIFWVTPVEKENLKSLRDHSRYKIVVTALHEAYPGHHLQFVHSNMIASKIRRHFSTPLFAEGWALYCEEMMFENGFYTDPRIRLLQLKAQLWRACRVVIDVRLQLKEMSPEEAVNMLVRTAKLEKTQAAAEVKRYTQTPTQPMSYIIGKQEILRVKDEIKKLKGNCFNIKKFHDELLSFGTIPLELIKKRMLHN